MAPHVIEKVGQGGREKRSARGGSISRPDGRRWQTFGRWDVRLAGAAGTAHVAPSERQKRLVACYVVCSRMPGSEDLGPNRKSRLKILYLTKSFYSNDWALVPVVEVERTQ